MDNQEQALCSREEFSNAHRLNNPCHVFSEQKVHLNVHHSLHSLCCVITKPKPHQLLTASADTHTHTDLQSTLHVPYRAGKIVPLARLYRCRQMLHRSQHWQGMHRCSCAVNKELQCSHCLTGCHLRVCGGHPVVSEFATNLQPPFRVVTSRTYCCLTAVRNLAWVWGDGTVKSFLRQVCTSRAL